MLESPNEQADTRSQPTAVSPLDAPTSPGEAAGLARDYAYYRDVFAGRAMPFAFVDLDLLDANVREVLARAGEKQVRVASKSVRSVAILRRILAADTRFLGLMCFTAREAVYLAELGFDDLLIGYPAWNDADLTAVARATAAGAHITLMIDSIAHVERIAAVAEREGVRLPVCIEIDLSLDVPGLHFGVWRSPLRRAVDVRPLLERIAATPSVSLDGIMGYEAQIAGVGDAFPGQPLKNALVRRLKQRSIGEIAARRSAVVELIRSYGMELRFVNGGGTGSLHTTREEPVVTEITAGSGFYSPALFDNYVDFRFLPAAGFAIEIVRQPRKGLYTCLGGGYVASGATGPEKQPQPYLPKGARLLSLEGAGEVQTPVRYSGPERLALGDPIFLRHSKAGELCERFRTLLLVSNGKVVDEVPTYRGDGQCFL